MNDNDIDENSAQIAINTANITKNTFDIDNHKHDPEGKYFCFVGEVYILFYFLSAMSRIR